MPSPEPRETAPASGNETFWIVGGIVGVLVLGLAIAMLNAPQRRKTRRHISR